MVELEIINIIIDINEITKNILFITQFEIYFIIGGVYGFGVYGLSYLKKIKRIRKIKKKEKKRNDGLDLPYKERKDDGGNIAGLWTVHKKKDKSKVGLNNKLHKIIKNKKYYMYFYTLAYKKRYRYNKYRSLKEKKEEFELYILYIKTYLLICKHGARILNPKKKKKGLKGLKQIFKF